MIRKPTPVAVRLLKASSISFMKNSLSGISGKVAIAARTPVRITEVAGRNGSRSTSARVVEEALGPGERSPGSGRWRRIASKVPTWSITSKKISCSADRGRLAREMH